MSSARNAMKQVDEEQMRLLVLRNRACNSGDDEGLVWFFKATNLLSLWIKSGNQLWVGVNCYLNDYNEDIFKQYVEKQDKMSSYIYEESPYDMDLTKKLFLAIWKEHRFNLRVYCEWIVYDDCFRCTITPKLCINLVFFRFFVGSLREICYFCAVFN